MTVTYALRETLGLSYLLERMEPQSPYGAERLRSLRFYGPGEREALQTEWTNVGAALRGLDARPDALDAIGHLMRQMRDVRGTVARLSQAALEEVELFELKRFLLQLRQLVPLFAAADTGYVGIAFDALDAALSVLDPDGRGVAGFSIPDGASPQLAAAREEKRRLEQQLRTTPAHGPARDALINARRDTVAREEAQTRIVRQALTDALAPYAEALLANINAICRLDLAMQKARLAQYYGMVRPEIAQSIRMTGMRHPQVADRLASSGGAFTPISIEAPFGATVLTGANMGGKSIALKTLALNVLLSQCGFFAAADSAQLPLFDWVAFTGGDQNDQSDQASGLSSFGAEITHLAALLRRVQDGARALLAIDEPGRGTNPREGAALVAALVKRLDGMRAVSVIATHFDGAAAEASRHYQAAGLGEVEEPGPGADSLAAIARAMDYGLRRVQPNAPAPQEALRICRLLGMDQAVTQDMATRLAEKGE